MTLKIALAIRAVPLSHVPYRMWPYCIDCRQLRTFGWHRCCTHKEEK